MTRDTAVRPTATRGLVVAVCVWLVVAPLAVGVAGAGAPAGSGQTGALADSVQPGDVGGAVESGASAARAGSTTVRLAPTTASVDEGATRTLDIVVSEADGGVGAVSGEIAVAESEYAEVVDLELQGDPGLQNVTVADTGDRVTFEGALMDTTQTGAVTVGEVTVRGRLEGTTDLALSIDSLGDEAGEPYDVGGTPDTALTVENTRNRVPLSVTADADSVAVDESVTFTVMRADSDARVEATVTVGNRTVDTGVDGEATVVVRESMVSDADTVTAVASKNATSQERYAADSVTLAVDSSASGASDSEGTNDGGAIVRTEPGSLDLTVGERATADIVVTNVADGVGAGEITATVDDPSVAEITGANVTGDPGIGGAETRDDGASMAAEFALRDGSDSPPVRVVEVTVRGVASGSTALSLSVASLGDERGNSYAIASTPDGGVTVSDSDDSDSGTATTSATETGDTGDGVPESTTSESTATEATTDRALASGDTASATPETAAESPTADETGTASADESQDTELPPSALLAIGVVVVSLLSLLSVARS